MKSFEGFCFQMLALVFFFGGKKLFCLFICNKTFTALLPNEWAVCGMISTNKIGKL